MTVLDNSSALTVTAIAEHLGVSRQTIYTWRKEGMPVGDDMAVLESWVADNHPPEDAEESLARQTAKAKLAKLNEEIREKSLANRMREGELVSREAVERWLSSHASESRQIIQIWPAEVVSEMPGEVRLQVSDILEEKVRLLLLRLASMDGELWADESVKDADV